MTPVNFCYFLQGFFEISEVQNEEISLTPEQVKMIRAHLNLVFFHAIDPETLKDKSEVQKLKYQKIHDGAESGDKITEKDFDELIKKSAPAISKYRDEPKSFFYDDSRITYNC